MRAKEYLQQLRRLDTVIDQKIKELDDLKVKSTCIGGFDYSKERVQTSPSGAKRRSFSFVFLYFCLDITFFLSYAAYIQRLDDVQKAGDAYLYCKMDEGPTDKIYQFNTFL